MKMDEIENLQFVVDDEILLRPALTLNENDCPSFDLILIIYHYLLLLQAAQQQQQQTATIQVPSPFLVFQIKWQTCSHYFQCFQTKILVN